MDLYSSFIPWFIFIALYIYILYSTSYFCLDLKYSAWLFQVGIFPAISSIYISTFTYSSWPVRLSDAFVKFLLYDDSYFSLLFYFQQQVTKSVSFPPVFLKRTMHLKAALLEQSWYNGTPGECPNISWRLESVPWYWDTCCAVVSCAWVRGSCCDGCVVLTAVMRPECWRPEALFY